LFDSKALGYQFSELTDDDLKIITDAEQKLSRQHNANQVLIAYKQPIKRGQSDTRS
jgi:chromosome segregation and condensation protein ScpB